MKIQADMSGKYKGLYRNEISRLPNWNYGNDGAYFITNCSKDRAHYMGEIVNGKMRYSPSCASAWVLWNEIKNPGKNTHMSIISPKPNTVSTVNQSCKSAVTKYCNRLGVTFAWQSRFYDHVIRDAEFHNRISDYIIENPVEWGVEK